MGRARYDLPDFGRVPASCDSNIPAGECLEWHVRPHLAKAEIYKGDPAKGFGDGYRALCPAHSDDHCSLTVNVGLHCLWYRCHARCDQLAVRAGLIARGVPENCLPISRKRKAELIDQLQRICACNDLEQGHKVMLVMIASRGLPVTLPRGADLEALAAEVGVSRRAAFGYRQRGDLQPTSRSYTSKQEHPQHPTSLRRVAHPEKCNGCTECSGCTGGSATDALGHGGKAA